MLQCLVSFAVIELANKILSHVGQCKVVRIVAECNSVLFCQLYETFSGKPAPGNTHLGMSFSSKTAPPSPPPPPPPPLCISLDTCHKTGGTEAQKCQMLVDTLAQHLRPHVTLEHIKGVDIACGDILAIRHLLDIFALLLKIPEETPFDKKGFIPNGFYY